MGVKISDQRSIKLQPLKKNEWLFEFAAIPGSTGQCDALAFVCHTASAPKVNFDGGPEIKRIHETFKHAGNPTFDDITCGFYDFIRSSSDNSEKSAADILYDWQCMIYNPLTGQMGYKTQYATSATLGQIDPAGNIIRAWNFFGIWPSSISYGDGLDYSSSEATDIQATFKYDLCMKVSDAKTATESA